jgi:hypothetical protein
MPVFLYEARDQSGQLKEIQLKQLMLRLQLKSSRNSASPLSILKKEPQQLHSRMYLVFAAV